MLNDKDEILNEGIHTAFLEKENGEWKLSYLSTLVSSSYDMTENNLKISETYHKNNPNDTDDILTDDFIGRHEHNSHTWNKENHRDFRVNNQTVQDSIYSQFGQGNWVATMYQRKGNYEGKDVEIEAMHLKRFENGKIAEIWEFYDSKQLD